MTELDAIAAALASGRAGAVLATLVRVDGSAYRGPGARMVVRTDGTTVGAISGGCLEKDVVARAEPVRATGRAALATWDLTRDDDQPWGLGMGCNATLDVLLEPCPAGLPAWLAGLREAEARRETIVLATVFAGGAHGGGTGDRVMVRAWRDSASGPAAIALIAGAALGAPAPAAIQGRAQRVLGERRTVAEDGVLYEFVPPPIALVACGEGADTGPLFDLAVALGWQPRAVRKDDPLGAIDERTGVIVMTHNYGRDRELLAQLLPSPAGYVGLLGPRVRTQRLLDELAARGARPTADQRARLHAPVGLDIGAETPHEIALAIVAEVRATFAGRGGGPLQRREGPIHDR